MCGKLGLNLGKPYVKVCGPEGCLMPVAATVTGSPSAGVREGCYSAWDMADSLKHP